MSRVVVITGSSSGIGAACAGRFAEQGASVLVNSSSSVQAGEKLAASLPDGLYVQGDVSRETDCRRIIDAALQQWGHIDVLVNNAGWTTPIPHDDLDAVTDEIWQRCFGVNVMGAWYLTRAALPALEASDDGCVINVSSVAGVRPMGSSLPYAVTKAALNHMTRLLAKALGPRVRVNAIAPGMVETPWTDRYPDVVERLAAAVPARRTATPDDVAEVCLMLARSTFMTGEVVVVDGGAQLLT